MDYLVTAERVSPGIGKKCLKRLSLFLPVPASSSKRLSAVVAYQGGDPAIRIREKTLGTGTVRSVISLPAAGCAGGGYQFPRTHKLIVGVPGHPDSSVNFMSNSRLTGAPRKAYTLRFHL